MLNTNDLFYTCYLLEKIRRVTNNTIQDIVRKLGYTNIQRIYFQASALHSAPLMQIVDEYILDSGMEKGKIKFSESDPRFGDIAKVYLRLIINTYKEDKDIVRHLMEVLQTDFIINAINEYTGSLFYEPSMSHKIFYEQGYIDKY